MKLKPNCVPEFTRKLEKDIIPLLQKQRGFRDEIAFVATGDKEALATSLWDRKEDAEAYDRAKYSDVLKTLSTVIEGTPHVVSGEVSNSTFHKVAVAVAAT